MTRRDPSDAPRERARLPQTPAARAGEQAMRLAAEGHAVFPCRADKAPCSPRGFYDASRDPEAVAALWRRHPGKLVGVVTGEASGIAVLDLDAGSGGGAWFEAYRGMLPRTRAHRTRSGGLHLVFGHRAGLRCSAGHIAPGVDVRADGGYIVWWPAAGLAVLDDVPALADWPDWLADLAMPPAPPPAAPARFQHVARYADAALRRAARRVVETAEGGRNTALNAETFSLTRLARAGLVQPGEIMATMARAGLAAGLGRREVERTVASAMRAGGVR